MSVWVALALLGMCVSCTHVPPPRSLIVSKEPPPALDSAPRPAIPEAVPLPSPVEEEIAGRLPPAPAAAPERVPESSQEREQKPESSKPQVVEPVSLASPVKPREAGSVPDVLPVPEVSSPHVAPPAPPAPTAPRPHRPSPPPVSPSASKPKQRAVPPSPPPASEPPREAEVQAEPEPAEDSPRAMVPEEPPEDEVPRVSRAVQLAVGQKLEVLYPGEGWVYVGEHTAQPGLRYHQRKLEESHSLFTFSAEREGDFVLAFSYFDVFRGDFVSDALAVKVVPKREGLARVVRAPEYRRTVSSPPDTVVSELSPAGTGTERRAEESGTSGSQRAAAHTGAPVRQDQTDTAVAEKAQHGTPRPDEKKDREPTVGGRDPVPSDAVAQGVSERYSPRKISPASQPSAPSAAPIEAHVPASAHKEGQEKRDHLAEARQFCAQGNARDALASLGDFFAQFPSHERMDEAWFLRGQAYEINGAQRNVRLALEAYKTILERFPHSPYWKKADERARFIKNFFIKIS